METGLIDYVWTVRELLEKTELPTHASDPLPTVFEYGDGLGVEILYELKNHEGFDGDPDGYRVVLQNSRGPA